MNRRKFVTSAGITAIGLSAGSRLAAANQLPVDLVAWWKAENNADDSVGKHHGKFPGKYAKTTSGMGFSYMGDAKEYVGVSHAPTLDFTELTIEATINLAALPSLQADWCILTKGISTTPTENYGLYIHKTRERAKGAELLFEWVVGGKFLKSRTCGACILSGTSHRVAVTVAPLPGTPKKLGIAFYVDGEQVIDTVGDRDGPLEPKDKPLQIGSSGPPWNNTFQGTIDDVRLWKKALVGKEIAEMHKKAEPGSVLSSGDS